MKILSQVWIGKDEAAKKGFSDSYAWHQAIWTAFPGQDGEPRTFLFRVDDKQDSFRLLILSQLEPEPPGWGAWERKQIAPTFLEYEQYRFQVRVNPTIKRVVRTDSGIREKNGRRVGIYKHDALLAWMERKAQNAGFELLECMIGPAITSYFFKNGKRGKHVSVDFSGLLKVTDKNRFKRAFYNGIGSAKAFGFGMLMLQPIA